MISGLNIETTFRYSTLLKQLKEMLKLRRPSPVNEIDHWYYRRHKGDLIKLLRYAEMQAKTHQKRRQKQNVIKISKTCFPDEFSPYRANEQKKRQQPSKPLPLLLILLQLLRRCYYQKCLLYLSAFQLLHGNRYSWLFEWSSVPIFRTQSLLALHTVTSMSH